MADSPLAQHHDSDPMIRTLSAIVLLGVLQGPATPTVPSSQAEVDVRNTHENECRIRTFVIVKRANRWLIMQDQNTVRGTL